MTDPPQRAGPKIRIVIADEHQIFRDGVRNLLSAEPDFEVLAEARNAVETLAAVAQYQPDIVLLDMDLAGSEALTVLRQLQATKNETRVISMTSTEDRDAYVQALRLGCSGIVPKKTTTKLLIKSIRKVNDGEIWLDRAAFGDVLRKLAAFPPPARTAPQREPPPLSSREREIVALVAQGFKNKEIAEKMFISDQTVKNHLHNIFEKLGVSDRLELALYAIYHHLDKDS